MEDPITTTSFIPKTRLTEPVYRRKSLGIGFLISFLLLLVSCGLLGGAYLYKQSLQKSVNDDIASLELARKTLESTLIDQLSRLNFSIDAAKILVGQHNAASEIFKIISDSTLGDVRFLNFDFKTVGPNPVVDMKGEASSYTNVAIQAKLFGQSDSVSQVSISNFNLKEGGKVDFSIKIVFNALALNYKP
jgi:hypothetical protein